MSQKRKEWRWLPPPGSTEPSLRCVSILVLLGSMAVSEAQDRSQAAASARPFGERYAIALHGGAGINPARYSEEKRQAVERSLGAALRHGQQLLAEGQPALEVVEQVVRMLEDDPLFNAGHGAVFNSEGTHELDASIMEGRTKACGAVAGVRVVKNPVTLARLVMQRTDHVLLVGDGADAFAQEMRSERGIELVSNDYFSTPERRAEWARGRGDKQPTDHDEQKKGTVGCVALDRLGDLAAATSTGGLTNKKFGRVGDTPIIGAGNYADNATCAVSCTGTGEYFIRHAVAFQVGARMQYQQLSLDQSVRALLFDTLPDKVGGIIAVDRNGAISLHTNTAGMARGAADWQGRFDVALER